MSTGRDFGVKAEIGKIAARHFDNVGIIFHHQHRAAGQSGAGGFGQRAWLRLLFRAAGQKQCNRGATARRAGYVGGTAGLLGKAVDLRKPEPGALAHFFGGEKRFENPRQNFGGNSLSTVGDADSDKGAAQALFADLASKRDRLGRDRQNAARGHGVARIEGEVEERKLEFAGVDLDETRPPRDQQADFNIAA